MNYFLLRLCIVTGAKWIGRVDFSPGEVSLTSGELVPGDFNFGRVDLIPLQVIMGSNGKIKTTVSQRALRFFPRRVAK